MKLLGLDFIYITSTFIFGLLIKTTFAINDDRNDERADCPKKHIKEMPFNFRKTAILIQFSECHGEALGWKIADDRADDRDIQHCAYDRSVGENHEKRQANDGGFHDRA